MTIETEVLDAPVKIAEYKPADAGISELRDMAQKTVYDVTTTAGNKTARAIIAKAVGIRTSIEAIRKEQKAPLLERGKLLDEEAKRLTALVVEIEDPIKLTVQEEDARKATIKAENERIELAKQQAIQAAIDGIKGYAVAAAGKGSADIKVLSEQLDEFEITLEQFAHRAGEATEAKLDTMEILEDLFNQAAGREAETARLAQERARQEQERLQREAQEKADREAEVARLKAEREAFEKEQAEVRAQQKAEQDRLDAERYAENVKREATIAEQRRKDQEAAAELKRKQDEFEAQRKEFEAKQAAVVKAEQDKADAEARAAKAKADAEKAAAEEKADAERAATEARLQAERDERAAEEARLHRAAAVMLDVLLQWRAAEAFDDAIELQNARDSRDAAIDAATKSESV